MGKYKDEHGYSRFENFLSSLIGVSPNDLKDVGQNYLSNFLRGTTQSGLTQQQVDLNAMQMQNEADIYGKQVEGMKSAGLNPALMYKSGASTAPSAPAGTNMGSMSDLMQLAMLPLNKKMLQAQISNVEADTKKKGAETSQIETLTPAQHEELVSKIKLNNKGLDEADARIAADLAQAMLSNKNSQWYDAVAGSEVALNEAYERLSDAQSKHNEQMVKESEQKIQNLKQDIVESVARCVVDSAQAGYLDQSTVNLMEEQGLIEIKRAGARVEYMISDKILKNYDVDKWFNRWQQGTSGLRDIGITYGSIASGGLFSGKPNPIGYKKPQ